jgi:hypothetical protein
MGKTVKKVVTGAIAVAAIATGVGAIAGLTAGASFLGLSGATAYFAQSFVINAVLGAVSSALTPKPSDLTGAADLSGQTIMQRNTIAPRRIVYGEVKTSGAVVFMETTNDNADLHYCVTLAGHEITAVDSVYFHDQVVKTSLSDGVEYAVDATTDPDYSGKAWVTAHFGDPDQTADGNLVSRTSMTVNHRLRNIAYLYAKCTYDRDVFANGIPNLAAIIKGRAVYDPRTTSTAYSNNAALCILDYLRDTRYGIGALDSEIDFASFSAAANICDETVSVASGGTEKRYTINGVIDTSKQPAAVLQDMLSACAGTIYYSNGQWKIRAGAYVTPTESLSMDDVIGQIKVTTRVSNQSNFNAVKGIFLSPDDNWQPVDYPSVTSSTFEAEDNGVQRFVDVTLPFTTSSAMAQRLAKITLYRNREQLTISVPCNLKAFKYEIGDTLYFTNERFGFDNKVFEVVGWELSNDGEFFGVNMVLKETSSTVYSWSVDDEAELTRNNTTLPSATTIAAPGVTVSDELRSYNEEVITTLIANVSSGSPFADRFEVEAQKAGDSEWVNLGQATGGRFELPQVLDGATYYVRARAISGIGVRSSWTTATHQVVGKTAPPSDVTGLTGNVIGNQYLLTWNAVPDLDLSHYRVRFAAEDGSPTYQNAITLVPKVSRPATSVTVPARNGTYFVRAVDKLGLVSENAVSVVLDSNIADIEAMNVVQTINEHPDFNGTFDDVVEIDEDDRLVLDTDLNFDAVLGDFDDAEGQFDGGDGNIDAEGFYYFSNSVDLGAVYTSRVTATIKSVRLDYVGLFDSAAGLFDDRQGVFDGDVNAFDDVDAELQVRHTEDDPTGSPTWSAWRVFQVSDIRAWGMEFRCRMTTTDDQATPAVNHLSVTVDMPDRVERGFDISSGASAKSVTFPNAFQATPAIGIGAQDLQTGDYYEISSKTRSGFIITFKNSSGTAVDRTFDYSAVGYGKEVS